MAHDHDIPTADQGLPPEPSERLGRQFSRFAKLSSSGGIVLLAMTVIAMVWANSPWSDSYEEIFADTDVRLTVTHLEHGGHDAHAEEGHDDAHAEDHPEDTPTRRRAGAGIRSRHRRHGRRHCSRTRRIRRRAPTTGTAMRPPRRAATGTPTRDDEKKGKHAWSPLPNEPHWWMGHSITHWINDLLMAVFFLVVGLEIKREILVGELASLKRATLPIFGALGGMVGPALIYVALNWGDDARLAGWGIPMATDIAFAVGILALLGSRIPNSLKVFLTSLAIVDDLGALTVIALFYTDDVRSSTSATPGRSSPCSRS